MVNSGMHKQDIMHKELCVGGAYNDISCFSAIAFWCLGCLPPMDSSSD